MNFTDLYLTDPGVPQYSGGQARLQATAYPMFQLRRLLCRFRQTGQVQDRRTG